MLLCSNVILEKDLSNIFSTFCYIFFGFREYFVKIFNKTDHYFSGNDGKSPVVTMDNLRLFKSSVFDSYWSNKETTRWINKMFHILLIHRVVSLLLQSFSRARSIRLPGQFSCWVICPLVQFPFFKHPLEIPHHPLNG